MKLFFRRLAIYLKNHVDVVPLILYAAALVVFTLAIYVYTPLDVKLTYPRWPWAQGMDDEPAPLAMIQFFACLSSILGVVAFLNYRSNRSKLMLTVIYIFSAIQILNDIFYISEIYRHLYDLGEYCIKYAYPVDAGLTFTFIHLGLVLASVILLIFSPLIQKYTSKIKMSAISSQDRDIQIDESEVEIEDENTLKKNEYGYNLDELDDEFVSSILGNKE